MEIQVEHITLHIRTYERFSKGRNLEYTGNRGQEKSEKKVE